MTRPDPRRPRTPAQVAPYVEVLGVEGAISFLLEFGGAEIYLTTNPTSRSRVVALIGRPKAAALARIGDRLPRRVPLAKPWIAAVWHSKGLPKAEIARRLHVSEVTVRTWLRSAGEPGSGRDGRDGDQLSLF